MPAGVYNKTTALRVVMPCSLVDRLQPASSVFLVQEVGLQMEVAGSPETSMPIYYTPRRYVTENRNFKGYSLLVWR
jgi:hypothetical protein